MQDEDGLSILDDSERSSDEESVSSFELDDGEESESDEESASFQGHVATAVMSRSIRAASRSFRAASRSTRVVVVVAASATTRSSKRTKVCHNQDYESNSKDDSDEHKGQQIDHSDNNNSSNEEIDAQKQDQDDEGGHANGNVNTSNNTSTSLPSSKRKRNQKKQQTVTSNSVPSGTRRRTWKKTSFEERLADLIAFKATHGHCCQIPANYPESSIRKLAYWCSRVRCSYRLIQENKPPRMSISTEQIKKLEEMGFDWNKYIGGSTFDERLKELAAYKAENGHCNAPENPSSPYFSLGCWCGKIRAAFKKIQEGKTPKNRLSPDQIERLDQLGFEWKRKQGCWNRKRKVSKK